VVLLGVIGWGFFTAALLPVFTAGLAWRGFTARAASASIATGASADLVLEAFRGSLPAGLEPGLAGAALGALVLVALSRRSR
jgi:Na+/proline symporter